MFSALKYYTEDREQALKSPTHTHSLTHTHTHAEVMLVPETEANYIQLVVIADLRKHKSNRVTRMKL